MAVVIEHADRDCESCGMTAERFGYCGSGQALCASGLRIVAPGDRLGEIPSYGRAPKRGDARRVAGFVYFIGTDQAVKIGSSKNPMRRLAVLQTGSPETLHLLATIPTDDMLGDEHEFHVELSADCIHGEWFHRTPQVEEVIQRYA